MLIRNWLKSLKAVRSHPYRPAFALFFSDKRVISATDEPSTTKFDSIMHSEDVLKDDSTKDEELHPHWSSMERRVISRKLKKEGPSGRGQRNPSGWDGEHV